jgi:transmembrane sensor
MTEQEIIDLLKNYQSGQLSQNKKASLESWYIAYSTSSTRQPSIEELKRSKLTLQNVLPLVYKKPVNKLWIGMGIAASLLLIGFLAVYRFNSNSQHVGRIEYANDVSPGRNGATLTLGNGRRIQLTKAEPGRITSEEGVLITKTAAGKLLYRSIEASNHKNLSNTLTTGNAEQVEVVLPDGTDVWLNSGSSLTFPASFSGHKLRQVSLSGEAYFEVAKNKAIPFIVETSNQQVKVVGTHFNINSYSDLKETKTTLLEGKVIIDNKTILVPGEQAISDGNQMRKIRADTELAVAWKNNKFMFEDAKIEEVMKMIERWYDVEVIYQGEKPADLFGGSVSRFDNVSKVLRILQLTGHVRFKIEGRRVTVMK